MPHFCIFSVLGNWPNFIFSLNFTLSPIRCTYIWYFVLQFVVYIRLHFCIQSFVYLPVYIFVSNLLFICLYLHQFCSSVQSSSQGSHCHLVHYIAIASLPFSFFLFPPSHFFIGPRSDHSLPMSVTHSLTHDLLELMSWPCWRINELT